MQYKHPKKSKLTRAVSHCWLSIKQAGGRLLAELNYDLTFEQLMVLFILVEKDGQNLRALAEQADRERTTMTRMVDGLERRNLVVRVPSKEDRRNRLVYLTRSGRELTENLEENSAKFMELAYKGISKKRIEEATETLNQVSHNLGYKQ